MPVSFQLLDVSHSDSDLTSHFLLLLNIDIEKGILKDIEINISFKCQPEIGLAERLEGALDGPAGDLGELGPEHAQARLGRLAHLDYLEADVLALPAQNRYFVMNPNFLDVNQDMDPDLLEIKI